jgi:hypothetical protein
MCDVRRQKKGEDDSHIGGRMGCIPFIDGTESKLRGEVGREGEKTCRNAGEGHCVDASQLQ